MHVRILIYANDIRIFTVMNSIEDSWLLQADIESQV